MFEHWLQLFDEVVHVFELAVDGGEADEGDLVDLPQRAEHLLADMPRLDFAVETFVDVGFGVADDGFDLVFANGPFVAGFFETDANFLAIEGDARAVLLNHLQRRFFNLFVRGETSAALRLKALAASANDKLLAGARINDLRFAVTTEWTHHVEAFPFVCTLRAA